MRADAFDSVHKNYESITATLGEISANDCTESGSHASGHLQRLRKFDFLFGLLLCKNLFGPCDELSSALQRQDISAAEMKRCVSLTIDHLKSLRTEASFNEFWESVEKEALSLRVKCASLPRPHKLPRRFDSGTQNHEFNSPKDKMRVLYFACFDNIIGGIEARFHQKGFEAYLTIDDLLRHAATGLEHEEHIKSIEKIFPGEFDFRRLRIQLQMLPELCSSLDGPITLSAIICALRELGEAMRLYSEVVALVKLFLVIPVTTATAERTFSHLRRLKSFLRLTMTQTRLNNLLLIHVYKDMTDSLDLRSVGKCFISKNTERERLFLIE
jgi:hypothetical protein